ncbi:hypothetical protein M409DRAFT_27564 [Zasmidium cellare ATCC 36951]|uniref:Uncharacterized protein n=1 Tax=Zasmidium cellare ATCC 36951 TaxID=1080233 RepID=A0A6A6C9Q6_ZASCE|nr:uncharacterized protein M409DRAFT_27564 [Zasmidium cellare ATCC 36951]KAF2162186.1 hypothetical protein M409DRAFT_27564 [Zasmidium cellare ATCC 36951]
MFILTALLTSLLLLLLLLLLTTALPTDTETTTPRDATPPPSLEEFLSSPMTFEKRQSNSSNTNLPSATVQLCTAPSFKGECTNATWPVNQCIDLKGYAGLTESFLPGEGFECLLMQGKCDATQPFAEVGDEDDKEGGDLTTYSWVGELSSYMCFTEIQALGRFVRVSRLRVATSGAKA